MTETSILPISSDNAEPPLGSQPPEDGGADGANRRKLLIVGGVVGAVIVAAAAFLLLHGGSSSPAPAAAVVPHGHFSAPAAPAAHKSTHKAKTTTLPKKAKADAGRNPFIPLYTAPVTGGTAAGPTTTVSSAPTTGTGTTPVTNPTPAPTSNNGLGNPTYIQLLSTKGTSEATFRVGYAHHKFKRYDVDAPSSSSNTGTVFGSVFALLSVKDGIATVQVGDGAPFQLTTGISRTT
jgi:hypothetical protein